MCRLIKKDKQALSFWSGGTTREIYIYPENTSYQKRDFRFRISFATVDTYESVFTKLDDVIRLIMPLSEKLELLIETSMGTEKTELSNGEVLKFDGGADVKSIGKGTDFNLMMKNCDGSISKVSGLVEFPLEGFKALYFLESGCYHIRDETFYSDQGDLLIVENEVGIRITNSAIMINVKGFE